MKKVEFMNLKKSKYCFESFMISNFLLTLDGSFTFYSIPRIEEMYVPQLISNVPWKKYKILSFKVIIRSVL